MAESDAEREAAEAFRRFVNSRPTRKFLVTPDELHELERRARALVAECLGWDETQETWEGMMKREDVLREQPGRAFARLVNVHLKYREPIVFDERWLQ